MDEKQKAVEYVRAQQEVEIANRALKAARDSVGPLERLLNPAGVQAKEEAAWAVMDRRDATEDRALALGQQLPPETKRIADEVIDQWKKGTKQ